MPKNHPIPHLSIVVPIGHDVAAFESTLISVLENQPARSEVIVPHDGGYTDPFDLCEEVRFVVADSSELVDLIATASSHALGRFVHVLSGGIRATCGWTDDALDCFDHFDTGVVAPVIRSAANEKIIAAGWQDGSVRLCKNAFHGCDSVDSSARIGAFLQASFWRRDVLRSLHGAFDGRNMVDASAAYHHLVREAGWRTELAEGSMVLCDTEDLPWQQNSLNRGLRLRAIRNHFVGAGWTASLMASFTAMLASIVNPKSITEAIGQGLAPLAADKVEKQLHLDEVTCCDDQGMIVSMPKRNSAPMRRAA